MRQCNTRLQMTSVALRSSRLLAFMLLFAGVSARAQKSIAVSELKPLPAGVTLPVRIGRSLRAGKVKAGTRITVRTTQRVPVGEHAYLARGAELDGEVVASTAGDGTVAHPATLMFRFTQLRYRKQTVPVATKAIAIANFTQVDDTFLPTNGGADRGNPSEASWTTAQVGGDLVVRSGWIGEVVGHTTQKVGNADYFGVYSLPTAPPTGGGPALQRAMGVFSTTASGLYGFEEGSSLESSGGVITLTCTGKRLLVRDGDDMLLEVVASP